VSRHSRVGQAKDPQRKEDIKAKKTEINPKDLGHPEAVVDRYQIPTFIRPIQRLKVI